MSLDEATIAMADGAATVIAKHLQHEDAGIRCAAAKALGALGDVEAAPALIQALLDEDPDVRTDAMEALASCARPDDAEAIKRSLRGDPVKEVKVFAIETLAHLDDRTSIPLLRALAKDRAEDEVAWEDEAGMWDDWLDIQVAAIGALGRMQASEVIDDLLDARADEMGQELDSVVFTALANMKDGGLSALFGLLRDRDARVRERVLKALSKVRPEVLLPMQAILLRDTNPAIRRLVIETLAPDSETVADLAKGDPDAEVRRATLAAFASARPDLAMAALRDPDEQVRAEALQAITIDRGTASDLAANLQAWMETSDAPLAIAATKALPRFAKGFADDPICRLVTNTSRPLDVRIAGLQALGDLSSETAIETLGEMVADPIRQIRTAALATLSKIAQRQDDRHRAAAEAILISAIRGEVGANLVVATNDGPSGADDVGASKTEHGVGRVTISPDGEIVTLDETADDGPPASDNVVEGRFPTSTLGAIQDVSASAPSNAMTAHLGSGGPTTRRRRVAVDGPDDIKQDIRIIALGMIGDFQGGKIDQVLLDTFESDDHAIRLAAFKAAAKRSWTAPPPPAMIEACKNALADTDAEIRSCAAIVIGRYADDPEDLLSDQVTDPDPIIREIALRAVARECPDKALAGLRDPSVIVQRTAMQLLIDAMEEDVLDQGIDICLVDERSNVLKDGCRRCSQVRTGLLASIRRDHLAKRQLRVALEALTPAV